MNTFHYDYERNERKAVIEHIGEGKPILIMHDIDKGHPNGKECHVITDTGIVFIYNENSKKLITTLIARPAQIQRYYTMINEKAPAWLLTIAENHTALRYNQI